MTDTITVIYDGNMLFVSTHVAEALNLKAWQKITDAQLRAVLHGNLNHVETLAARDEAPE